MSTETPARKDADTEPRESDETELRASEDTELRTAVSRGPADPDDLPPFTEQLSQQLGGVKGVVEAAVPITLFVVLNPVLPDRMGPLTGLQWAIVISASSALAIAGWRAARKESVRHALNGLFGIALGAFLAWRSDDARDFYLPGIIQGAVYGVLLIVSALVRHPIIGWIYAVVAQGGKKEWRDNTRLVDVLSRITILWGVVFILKNALRSWLYVIDAENALGLVTLFGGWPVTIALTAFTIWAVRRHMKTVEAVAPETA
ncbi:DUF3159 domain-containing protein [Glycomyces sp. TRM65418]|uniref:DUF3159 domain-containing protein n=1 Tax=Glycomyces sp. TRM65418 TaxID=2867006 RepID=UPI001CE69057|nr:DUF3159 domain-containing protein [Glycomyces sp. TRM65418]MCC3764884.1 DUF3159 domain-containing protein [Glycomyces sp. TRM65418]QZD54528.1 DUF3159 domain-containing protein [Glycomyces sp. TRM65418]